MPFTKVGKDDYTSPSGRHYNTAQVRLWHAQGGKFPGQSGPGEKFENGGRVMAPMVPRPSPMGINRGSQVVINRPAPPAPPPPGPITPVSRPIAPPVKAGGAGVAPPSPAVSKGLTSGRAMYAQGGAVQGSRSIFMKSPDAVRTDKGVRQSYGKGGGRDAPVKRSPRGR